MRFGGSLTLPEPSRPEAPRSWRAHRLGTGESCVPDRLHERRDPWLAAPSVHETLCCVWQRADAWLVGRYVLMPDHLHLFAGQADPNLDLDRWVRYWKSLFTRERQNPEHRWQSDHWDTRLRNRQSYEEKWNYVRLNPVRQGLVANPDDWPFQGELNHLRW